MRRILGGLMVIVAVILATFVRGVIGMPASSLDWFAATGVGVLVVTLYVVGFELWWPQ